MTDSEKPKFDEIGPDGRAVRDMFADCAPRYDRLNRTLSAGIDVLWRRRTLRRALEGQTVRGLRVLDVCSGTGDLALAFAARGCSVMGVDFCKEMLFCGAQKRRARELPGELGFVAADAQHLPFEDDSFDVATVAFGIRNVHDPLQGLRELERVLRPGGRVLVLEFSKPRTKLIGPAYLWYFRKVLPKLGKLLAPATRRHEAYDYLPESVMRFPEREEFCAVLEAAGLQGAQHTLLSFGIACLYEAQVPAACRIEADLEGSARKPA